MVGWYNAAMSVMGTIMSFCAGLFAVGGWQDAFKVYLITIPILIMLIAFLPSMRPKAMASQAEGAAQDDEKEDEVKPGWRKATIPLTIEVLFVCLCYFTVLYMMALFIVDGGVGDEAFVGTVGVNENGEGVAIGKRSRLRCGKGDHALDGSPTQAPSPIGIIRLTRQRAKRRKLWQAKRGARPPSP
nr:MULTISPECIES: MFS transporter [unclassified Adlercreutzia]